MLLGKSWLCWQVISQRLELSIEKGKSVLPVPILFEEYQLPKREKCSVSSSVAKWKALPSSDLVKQSNHLKCGWEYSVLPCRHRTILSVPEWPQIALFHLFFFLSFPLSCFLFIFPQVTLSNGAKLAANPFDVRAVYMRVLERNQFRLIKSANSRQRLQPARAHVMNTRSLLLQPECN